MSTSNSFAIWGIMNETMYFGSEELEEKWKWSFSFAQTSVKISFTILKTLLTTESHKKDFIWKILIVSSETRMYVLIWIFLWISKNTPDYINGYDFILKIFVIIMYDESKHHLRDISYTMGINVIGDRRVLTDCHFVDLRIRNSTQ